MNRTYTTKWARTCAERIASGVMTEPEIRKMRSILGKAYKSQRYVYRRGTTSCTAGDADALIALLWEHPVQVSDDQARKGVEWLHSAAYTPGGKRRATEDAQEFTEADLAVLAECKATPRFSLVDIDRENFAPIYRCHGAEGSFDYLATSWQNGGAFQIVGRNT